MPSMVVTSTRRPNRFCSVHGRRVLAIFLILVAYGFFVLVITREIYDNGLRFWLRRWWR